jgi:hypothetical protein
VSQAHAAIPTRLRTPSLRWILGVTTGADMIEPWSPEERIGMFIMGALPLAAGCAPPHA